MRRNSENLLVLACSDPGRRFTTAQPLLDVIRAAGAEIADYARVEPEDVADVAVTGHAVGDAVHLLAELLENATAYSAPETRVRVTARHNGGGVLVAIYDNGIGMAPADLAEANHRLATRTDLTASLAGTMGLLVVARLAARHGVAVRLRSHPGAGTVALAHLPGELLVLPVHFPGPLRRPPPRAVGAAPVPVPAVIYEELSSAWFRRSPQDWASPGDREREQVERVLVDEAPGRTGSGLPVRRPGARLVPGSVSGGTSGPARVDPDRVRTRLAGFGSAVRAMERDEVRS